MKETDAAANFSPEAIGGGGATAAFAAGVGVEAGVGVTTCVGVADGVGTGLALLLAVDVTVDVTLGADVSSLVKYRNPPTPIAARQTSVTAAGHIQLGDPATALAGFLTCGVA